MIHIVSSIIVYVMFSVTGVNCLEILSDGMHIMKASK